MPPPQSHRQRDTDAAASSAPTQAKRSGHGAGLQCNVIEGYRRSTREQRREGLGVGAVERKDRRRSWPRKSFPRQKQTCQTDPSPRRNRRFHHSSPQGRIGGRPLSDGVTRRRHSRRQSRCAAPYRVRGLLFVLWRDLAERWTRPRRPTTRADIRITSARAGALISCAQVWRKMCGWMRGISASFATSVQHLRNAARRSEFPPSEPTPEGRKMCLRVTVADPLVPGASFRTVGWRQRGTCECAGLADESTRSRSPYPDRSSWRPIVTPVRLCRHMTANQSRSSAAASSSTFPVATRR